MIGSWLTYIRNMLMVVLRQSRTVAFIEALNFPSVEVKSELDAFIHDLQYRSSITSQVCWLEKLLSDRFRGDITITEGNGLFVDFHINGIQYADKDEAYALINRYKLAGKSFAFVFPDLTITAMWGDGLCETQPITVESAAWSNPVCVEMINPSYYLILSIHPGSTGTPGDISANPFGPYSSGTVVEIRATIAAGGYFNHWEIYTDEGWQFLSNQGLYLHAVVANTKIRAFYSYINQ